LGDIDNAIRDARVLARRASSMLRMGEGASIEMCQAVESLARGVRLFEAGLGDPAEQSRSRGELIEAVRLAVDSLATQMTLNRAAVVAQVRSLAADILLASGMTRDELDVALDL
jgi:hypothetical protein